MAKGSLGVVAEYPRLLILPLVSGVAGFIYLALLLGGSVVGSEALGVSLSGSNTEQIVVLFLSYFGTTFIATFFNGALVHCSRDVFEGREPSIKRGMSAALSKIGYIFVWAFVVAVISVILRIIENEEGMVGQIAAALFGAAWSIITYFVLPVLMLEDVGVKSMFTKSGETFKNNWGDTLGTLTGVGLLSAVFTLVGVIAGGGIALALISTPAALFGVIAGVAIVVFAFIVGTSLKAIAKTALYVYATEGRTPPEFDKLDFQNRG